ncbi:MAG: O-antigen ligase family protein, partial [Saprospiraceae bacterium]|nr:O-antigen ligase family protein [Saprospiraceae bacterium]
MIERLSNEMKIHWPEVGSALFLVLTMLAFFRQQWEIVMIPIIIAIGLFAFFKPKYLFFAIVFMTPFSINLEELGRGDIAFYLPTEPLLFGFMLLIILAQLCCQIIPRSVIRHPVSIAFFIYLGWLFITSLTSVQPIVSLKYLVSRAWYIIPIYFAGATIFLQQKNIKRFLLLYLVPFLAIVIYTTFRHASYGFEEDAAHWVMEPFYRDHTQYGAVVAFFIPIVFGFITRTHQTIEARMLGILALMLLFVTMIYTYSRAALLSVLVAFIFWLIVKSRATLSLIFGIGLIMAILVLFSFDDLLMQLQKNRIDSSENLVENVESITNISTDASNLERLNRWNSAFEMTREKPLVGFGPGTYMFQYAPYQKSKDLTIISTNFGDVGNAHSEYLGPLAETGIPGLLT